MTITDEYMMQMIAKTKSYCVVILKAGPLFTDEASKPIVWEHGRRNFSLREQGLLSIVCPVMDGSELTGVAVYNASLEETKKLMEEDPGVQAGIFTYEVHECRSFPGDQLPS
ncbi:hypothetical protein EXU57_02415 [Segetibacter sp. 3557_3]|uniref:hypothetical protein n=1 Tax=Segetibacter sp. 3557_3 TaxID=2547429 RepID=UPI001058FE92|nr:hypothetical protein [Segetibacter sp. 3557_3]TDH28948.1 hypothetical protein EXU57_02415 [Segetibacter sp. 3557_3]